jgi:tRNA pseudouridine38-40 synthase
MPRYKLTIEYDGTPFAGWQRQADAPTVQGTLEQAIFAMSGETVTVHGAGRTDAGVHATGQVAHIDLSREWRTDKIRDAMNAHMKPQPVAVLTAEAVPDDFEARFSAQARHYVYRILNRRAPPTLMLIGKHDFTTFRAAECQANSPIRTLDRLDVVRSGETIEIFASARSFLHHQVRSITGSLEHVGSGKWTAQDLKDALEAKDRARCGMVAPPTGLYLLRVDY